MRELVSNYIAHSVYLLLWLFIVIDAIVVYIVILPYCPSISPLLYIRGTEPIPHVKSLKNISYQTH